MYAREKISYKEQKCILLREKRVICPRERLKREKEEKRVQRVLKKKIELSYDPATPLLGIYQRKP